MSESPRDRDDALLERYRNGELTLAEMRALAQKSLESEDLFETLAVDGLLREAADDPGFRRRWLGETERPRRSWRMIWGASVAASLALVVLAVVFVYERPSKSTIGTSRVEPARLTPSINVLANAGQPILLEARLSPPRSGSPVFRGETGSERLPRRMGRIVRAETMTIDLGSVDGLVTGFRVQVVRDGAMVATIQVTRVFRDRSRGEVLDGAVVRGSDNVRIPPDLHLAALRQRAESIVARGEYQSALNDARTAYRFAADANVDSRLRLAALEQLAETEYLAGDPATARKLYSDLVTQSQNVLTPIETLSALEGLGTLSLASGEIEDGERALIEAERIAATSANRRAAHIRALNNIGVLAEMQKDLSKAVSLYERAHKLALTAGHAPSEVQAIEKNLHRLQDPR